MTDTGNECLGPRDEAAIQGRVGEPAPTSARSTSLAACQDAGGRWALLALAGALLLLSGGAAQAQKSAPAVPATLATSPRPTFPSSVADLWLVPDTSAKTQKALGDFANGVRLFQSAKYAEALPLLSAPALAATPLAAYSSYYTGLAYLNLSRAAEARTIFTRLKAEKPVGYLSEGAALREAEAAEAQGDHAGAAKIYQELVSRRTASPDAVLLALGRAQAAAGDRQRAAETFARLYYEYPLGDLATVAATELDGLKDLQPLQDSPLRVKLELGRGERLFASRRYQAAQQAFEALRPVVSGDDAELAALRVAECDHYLHHYRKATEALGPYLERASRKAEARFFYLTATRELGDHDQYVRLSRELIDAFPDSSWAEETLNNLATHFILSDEDERADATFRELYAKFPKGAHAERAAWKAGWWAYKHGRYPDTTAFFESAAAAFPRSDYRPAYLYWSARSREATGDKTGAAALYRIVAQDYLNSYYGRVVVKRVGSTVLTAMATPAPARPAVEMVSSVTAGGSSVSTASGVSTGASGASTGPSSVSTGATSDSTGASSVSTPMPETAKALVRLLLSLELYDAARDELLHAQRTYGNAPAIDATLAWVYNKLGDYRRGIVTMKRAYPAYMSAEAADLPADLLKVIFPLDYWALIKRYAPASGLDPYLVAALINQESSFLADARSGANAIGLMQLLPSTARRYARRLHIRRFSPAALTKPEVNIQLGTTMFAELVRRLGAVHYALASYNAGEHRISGWTAERPGLERDEFIDDIPFPETQAYVKKIISTAEDYRRVYGPDGEAGATRASAPKAQAGKAGDAKKAGNKAKAATPKKKGTKG